MSRRALSMAAPALLWLVAPAAAVAADGVAAERGLYESARQLSERHAEGLEEQALAELRRYAARFPEGPAIDDVHLRLARLQLLDKHPRRAAARLLQVVLVSPGSLREAAARDELEALLGRRCLGGQRARYREVLERARERGSRQPPGLRRLAFLQALVLIDDPRTGEILDDELDSLLGAPIAATATARITADVADFSRRHGDPRRAIALYDRLTAIWPDDPLVADALIAAGDILARDLERPVAALGRYRDLARRRRDEPEEATALLRIARLERRQLRQPRIAVRDLKDLLARHPDHPDAFEALRLEVEIETEDLDDPAVAVATLRAGLATFGSHSRAPELLQAAARLTEERLHDRRRAAAALERLAGDYPGYRGAAAALLHAGRLYERVGDREGARRAYRRLLVTYPSAAAAGKARARVRRLGESER